MSGVVQHLHVVVARCPSSITSSRHIQNLKPPSCYSSSLRHVQVEPCRHVFFSRSHHVNTPAVKLRPPFTPLYIVKLGFTGVYSFSYFCSETKHIIVGTSYNRFRPSIYVVSKSKKNITNFHLKIITYTAVTNQRILNRHVIVMILFFRTVLENLPYLPLY